MERLKFDYNEMDDILTIEGIRYAGAIFRDLGWETPIGECFRIEKREDGVLILSRVLHKE